MTGRYRNHHPPARGHRGLLGVSGRDHRLLGGGQQPSASAGEVGLARGVVLGGGDPGGFAV